MGGARVQCDGVLRVMRVQCAGRVRLPGAALHVRSRGERVVPSCPFIAQFIARHPEHADLVER